MTLSTFEMSGVSVTFGGLVALSDVSLTVAPGQVLGVIGPNGAGKTTLFNVACGFVRPDTGTLTWRDTELRRLRPHHLAGHGIARSLQELGLFDRMTVLDNVLVGAGKHAKTGFWSSLMGLTKDERALTERAMAHLEDFDIADVAHRYPSSLPYPVRKRVALARALAGEPDLLLLDEPAGGLSSVEITEIGELVRGLAERMSVMLVEHHMDLVMGVCDEIVVLDFGKVIAHGTPDEIRADPAVQAAYLGEEVAGADR
ncbi:ABC transporter ATP-binding protein [Amycolatopsis pittospori]|uniref:ABC transporter ATP-binding protein n=1 Tax=Amycolatopsis pittospori TaxID=2749434 RepID=UPI0038B3E1DF